MKLSELQKHWDQFGRQDPYWAILTHPDKKNNKWNESDFFQTGRRAVDRYVKIIHRVDPKFHFGAALDFGCGVGRLTQGLAQHFEHAVGVDIAESMIAQATKRAHDLDNCTFLQNNQNELALDGATFDFVLSDITLQHMKPQYATRYIVEFFRVVKPGGIIIFQLPSNPDVETRPKRHAARVWTKVAAKLGRSEKSVAEPIMEMYWIDVADVVALLRKCGGVIQRIKRNQAAGPTWISYTYIVSKPLE